MIHNWNNSKEPFSSIVNTYEIKENLKFQKNFSKDVNLIERIFLGLDMDYAPTIYVSITYSKSPEIEFLDQKSFNTFFTFFEFVEMESFPLQNLHIATEYENLKYSDLPGHKKRKVRDCYFKLVKIEKTHLTPSELKGLEKVLI